MKKNITVNLECLADEIVSELFRNGAGQEAKRLVLELPGGKNGGGWSQSGARSAIIKAAQQCVHPTDAIASVSQGNSSARISG